MRRSLGSARESSLEPELRAEALAAAAGGVDGLDAESFEFLAAQLGSEAPVAVRSAAASALATAPLTADQRSALADAMAQAGPMEAPTCCWRRSPRAATMRSANGSSAGVAASSGKSNLLPGDLEAVFEKIPAGDPGARRGAARFVARGPRPATGPARRAGRRQLEGGDERRGQLVFNSAKTACRSCHRIGYVGGRVGPDLTRIGEIRTERDLLEAVVYPSASFVRSFEPIVVVTADDIHNGVPLDETDESLLLATGAETEVRIARAEIEEVRPGAVSVMPSGLDEELSRQELADLIAYLKQTQWGPRRD